MPHILVVEDDAATRDLLEQYLADYKFRVTAAATTAEAEKRLA
jgi:two-component system OmpR family response regulator